MMAVPSAAMALRESFGDRKPPDITRKIKACVACRKQKIKCHMDNANPPCRRCEARGLPCTVNRSLQMLLENDAGWKEDVERRLREVEETLRLSANQRESFPEIFDTRSSPPPAVSGSTTEPSEPEATSSHQQSETTDEVMLNLSCSLGSFPGSSIMALAFIEHGAHYDNELDLISCGLISLEEAEEYFAVYKKFADPCIYHILAEGDCLASIRARSSFLTAAICTVGSFCTASAQHQICYNAFIKEVSSRVFSRHHCFDDVRALCIGAFWLSKESSVLIGLAVRMAAEMNLHRCITKMPHIKRECYERTRLYFLVYICDHHCSLIYGKPPMTGEFRSLKSPRAFLQSRFRTTEDAKLIGEVELWCISSRVFDVFGADINASIPSQRTAELDALSRSYDICHSDLLNLIPVDDGPANFSREIFDLHIHSAKLFLFSHTFRGSSQSYARSPPTLNGMKKFERCALESALSIVRSVSWGNEIERRLEMLPSYFGTMIAFAAVFLLKAWEQRPTMGDLDENEVTSALNQLVNVFRDCSTRFHPKHPLRSVAKSLETAMSGYQSSVNYFDGGFTAEALQSTVFALDNDESDSLTLNYLESNNNLSSDPDGFGFDLFGL